MKERNIVTNRSGTTETAGVGRINRKIGNTIYRVTVQFSKKSRENAEDKILRLAKHDAEHMKEAVGQ